MAANEEPTGPENLLQEYLDYAREQYVEEQGEEPPDEFMEDARQLILRTLAASGREEHREVYDALADE